MTIKGLKKRIEYFIRYGKTKNPVDELRKNGVKIGKNVQLLNAHIDWNHGFLISIGNNVTITNAAILSHDGSTKGFIGYSKIGNVTIGDNVFIGYGSVVLPNVTIGNNVIVGAGSIVTKNIPENSVVVGNPARVIMTLDKYLEKQKANMKTKPVFHKAWELTSSEKEKAKIEILNATGGFDL